MTTRRRKPAVRPEVRKDWLRRREEDGESPPTIAGKDGFDVRTVRKQLEIASDEREMREARGMILRNALEKHYLDLCNFAGKVDSSVTWPLRRIPSSLKEDRMWQALKEHLPKSPIWKALPKLDELADLFDADGAEVRRKAREESEAGGWKFRDVPLDQVGVGLVEGAAEMVARYVVSMARGERDPKDVLGFSNKEVAGTGLHEMRMGAYLIGYERPKLVPKFKEFFSHLLEDALGWEEGRKLHYTVVEIRRQSQILGDEIAIVTLRRVVPGRCKYCPL